MIVVVGGQARKVGKTRAMCDIIAATPGARWVAIKISPHEHGPPDRPADTDRYLAAGAVEASLVRELPRLPPERNVIIESNSVLDVLTPDLFVFVTDESNPEWKDSARKVIARADYVVNAEVPSEAISRIRDELNGRRASFPDGSPHRRLE